MLSPKSPEPAAWFCLAKFTEPVLQEENEVSQYRSISDDSGLACCTLPVHIASEHASPSTPGTRFSITTPTKTANSSDVIPVVDRVFTQYATPLATYCDQGQHFDNQEVREFFRSRNVSLIFSPTGASQSTGMIEISNRLLEDILRKADMDLEMALNRSTKKCHFRIL